MARDVFAKCHPHISGGWDVEFSGCGFNLGLEFCVNAQVEIFGSRGFHGPIVSQSGAIALILRIFQILVAFGRVCRTIADMEATINFRCPIELKERIETLARRSLISVADVARIAVIEKLERDEVPAAQASSVEVRV